MNQNPLRYGAVIYGDIELGHGLLPDGIMPVPQPTLNNISDVLSHLYELNFADDIA